MGFFSDLGDAVSSGLSAVGDVVEDVVDTVVDTVEDVVDAVVDGVQDGVQAAEDWANDKLGGFLGGVVNVIGGIISGVLEGVQDIIHGVFNVVRDVVGIVGSILRLDFAGVVREIVNLVIDVVGLAIDVVRFAIGGYVVGGIVHAFERSGLISFVSDLLQEKFGNNPDLLASIRGQVGLDGGSFGFPLPAQHRVFRMDSANLPLWDMHNRGVIDLYQMAGLLSFDSFQVFPRPRTLVRSVGAGGNDNILPVNRWLISHYIQSQGTSSRIRVYAMSRDVVAENLGIARSKCEKLGVKLKWNDGERFSWFRNYTVQDLTSEAEYRFALGGLGQWLLDTKLRTGAASDNCTLLALGAFRYATDAQGKEQFGLTAGRTIKEGDEASPCATGGRDDGCCSTLDLTEGSGVIYRDLWPAYVFRYVLPHEVGHYLGLCHFGHDGFQNLMWKPDPAAGLSPVSWSTFKLYYESEPTFTYADARNCWRFLVSQMMTCLGAAPAATSAAGQVSVPLGRIAAPEPAGAGEP